MLKPSKSIIFEITQGWRRERILLPFCENNNKQTQEKSTFLERRHGNISVFRGNRLYIWVNLTGIECV